MYLQVQVLFPGLLHLPCCSSAGFSFMMRLRGGPVSGTIVSITLGAILPLCICTCVAKSREESGQSHTWYHVWTGPGEGDELKDASGDRFVHGHLGGFVLSK